MSKLHGYYSGATLLSEWSSPFVGCTTMHHLCVHQPSWTTFALHPITSEPPAFVSRHWPNSLQISRATQERAQTWVNSWIIIWPTIYDIAACLVREGSGRPRLFPKLQKKQNLQRHSHASHAIGLSGVVCKLCPYLPNRCGQCEELQSEVKHLAKRNLAASLFGHGLGFIPSVAKAYQLKLAWCRRHVASQQAQHSSFHVTSVRPMQ